MTEPRLLVVCDGWVEPRHPRIVLQDGDLEGLISHGICEACKEAVEMQAYHASHPHARESAPWGHNRCAICGTLSPLYALWPSCRECQSEICRSCAAPGTFVDADLDQHPTALCPGCSDD